MMTSDEAQSCAPVGKTRRTHVKSRYGCKNCKARRIKCDESRPSCENCVRRKKICDFQSRTTVSPVAPQQKVAISRTNRSDAVVPSSTISTHRPRTVPVTEPGFPPKIDEFLYPGQDPRARVFEIRLFQYYISRTKALLWPPCGSAAFEPEVYDLARKIPTLAMQNDSVMDVLLSFAAMGLEPANPGDRRIQVAVHTYMDRALKKFQIMVASDPKRQDEDVLYTMARLISFYALIQNFKAPQKPSTPKERVLEWLSVFRGLKSLGKRSTNEGSRFAKFVGHWQYPYKSDEDVPPSLLEPFAFLLADAHNNSPSAELIAYRHIIAFLASIYNTPEPSRQQMWWFLIENRSDFIAYCTEGKSKAWLLLGLYLRFVGALNQGRPLGQVAARDIVLIRRGLQAGDVELLQRAENMVREKFAEVDAVEYYGNLVEYVDDIAVPLLPVEVPHGAALDVIPCPDDADMQSGGERGYPAPPDPK